MIKRTSSILTIVFFASLPACAFDAETTSEDDESSEVVDSAEQPFTKAGTGVNECTTQCIKRCWMRYGYNPDALIGCQAECCD